MFKEKAIRKIATQKTFCAKIRIGASIYYRQVCALRCLFIQAFIDFKTLTESCFRRNTGQIKAPCPLA